MAVTDFTGTNTEKIDRLATAVVALQTLVRILAVVVAITLTPAVGMTGWLLSQAHTADVRLARVEERLGQVERRLDQMDQRLERIERAVEKLAARP